MSKTKQALWTKFGGKEFFARMAENATNDGEGNEISQTYATKDVATTTADGLLSKDDKAKLNNIAEGAQVNKIESISANSNALTIDSNKNVDIPLATSEVDGLLPHEKFPLIPVAPVAGADRIYSYDDDTGTSWQQIVKEYVGNMILDQLGNPVTDEEDNIMYEEEAVPLWLSYKGVEFGARRAYDDQDGHNIKATYLKKTELNEPDEAPESDIDNMFIIPHTVVIGDRRYRTVTIGNQEWLAENLDYKFECNGATIPVGGAMESTEPRAWYYNNDEATYGVDGTYKCGLLYNWYATKYLDDHKSTLLADGWRVPYYADWDALCRAIGYPTDAKSRTTGGTYLKACDNSVTNNWPDGWNGTDEHGLSIIPAGYCDGTDSSPFWRFGSDVNYWTPDCAWDEETINKSGTYMHFKQTEIAGLETSGVFNAGYSIRLVRTIS